MKLVALPEITVITMGQSPPSSSYNSNGEGLPFFQGKTDFGDIYPTARAFCTEPNKIAEPNDILMSVRAPVGSTNLNRVRSCIGRGLASIRCSSKIDLYYLFYFLRFYESEIINFSRGSTFDSISRDDLDRIRVPLPPIAEQKRIAAICAKADRLRRTRRYALELSDTYLRSVFLEMFGDPAENPKSWKISELNDVCNKVTDGTHQPPVFTPSGIPFIFVQNIAQGEIDFSNTRYVSEETYHQLTRNTKVDKGDIIYSSVGVSFGVAVQVSTNRKFTFQRHIAHLKPKHDEVNSVFLSAQMNNPFVYSQAARASRGAAQPTVNLGDIKEFKVIIYFYKN